MTELTQGGRKVRSLSTYYNGTTFRSALEAKWAQALDLLFVEWEYEPAAVILSNGVTYLPDFRLPRAGQFIEVKPRGTIQVADFNKMTRLCEISANVAPTALRPEFQVVWCDDAGFAVAFGSRAGETHTRAMALWRPALVLCNVCSAVYFSGGAVAFYGASRCHVCGNDSDPTRYGDPNQPFYGVHNG